MSEETVFVERLSNLLQNGDRNQKIKVLKELDARLNSEDKIEDLYVSVAPILFRSLYDHNEGIRERSLNVIRRFIIEKLPRDKENLKSLIPSIYSRSCIEISEELLIIYLDFLTKLFPLYKKDLSPYVEELVDIAVKRIPQSAPEVKKSASMFTRTLVETIPAETYASTKKLISALSENVFHQHWRVRVITIETIEIVMLKGDNKCLPNIVNIITKSLFDDIEHVRMAVTKLAGCWMTELFDRYSFFSHLLPIMLTSLNDDSDNIQKEAKLLWEKAGHQYLQENEKDYKDRKDYELEIPNYPGQRPGLGCRILVEREGSKFLLALAHEMTDWNDKVRIKSSSLLIQYALHAETSVTQSLHKILPAMSKAAVDDLSEVVENVRKAAEFMGFFVPPEVFCDLLVPSATIGDIIILSSFINGSNLKPPLAQISSLFRLSFDDKEHTALLELISSLYKFSFFEIGDKIWSILISIAGLNERKRERCFLLLDKFVNLRGGDKEKVYKEYSSSLLNSLLNVTWSAHCHELFVLSSLVENANFVINLNVFVTILEQAMSKNNDPEVILKVTLIINQFLEEHHDDFFVKKIVNIVLDHLKWKPGRTAEAIRTVASTCLFTCVKTGNVDFEPLIPIVISLLEDAEVKTRIISLHTIQAMSSKIVQDERFYSVITSVLKRMEDADQKVRKYALETIEILYGDLIQNNGFIDYGVLEFVFSTLLIHLDDQNCELGNRVLECLKSISTINPQLFHTKFQASKLRNQVINEKLVEHMEQLKINQNLPQ